MVGLGSFARIEWKSRENIMIEGKIWVGANKEINLGELLVNENYEFGRFKGNYESGKFKGIISKWIGREIRDQWNLREDVSEWIKGETMNQWNLRETYSNN